jgi:hypothetical protein
MRFETTIPVFEQMKTVHALDRGATVIGYTIPKQNMKEVIKLTNFTLCLKLSGVPFVHTNNKA